MYMIRVMQQSPHPPIPGPRPAPQFSCYFCITLRGDKVVRAWLRGPNPPWSAARHDAATIDTVAMVTTGPSFAAALASMRDVLASALHYPTSPLYPYLQYLNDVEVQHITERRNVLYLPKAAP